MKIKDEYMQRIKWYQDSPDAGDPSCLCSFCEKMISEEECPIRMWNNKTDSSLEARFHEDCFKQIIEGI